MGLSCVSRPFEAMWLSAPLAHHSSDLPKGPPILILGTAQLTEPYGYMLQSQAPVARTRSSAEATLEAAGECGFVALDTAPAYGDAEEIIGSSKWHLPVHTKLDPHLAPADSLERSLARLQREEVDVLYIHDVDWILKSTAGQRRQVSRLKGNGARALGISVYEPHELLASVTLMDFDVAQIPLSPIDQRFRRFVEDGPTLPGRIAYIARSALLQGVVATPSVNDSRVSARLRASLLRWQNLCRALDASPAEGAVAWITALDFLDAVILGAESAEQARELARWPSMALGSKLGELWGHVDVWPDSDPRSWPKAARLG